MIRSAASFKNRAVLSSPGLVLLACRPIMAVGWTEIFILFALVVFLFGPLLFRLFTWWQKYRSDPRHKEKRNK